MSYLVKPSNVAQQYAQLLTAEERAAYEVRVREENKRIANVQAEYKKGERARLLERKVHALENQAFALERIALALEGRGLQRLEDMFAQIAEEDGEWEDQQ